MANTSDFENQKNMLKHLAKSMDRRQVESLLLSFAETEGITTFKEQAAIELIRITTPGAVVPDVYGEYRQIVEDGIYFLLSNISHVRLVKLIVDQLLIGENVGIEERLIELAKGIPTLHKLGQIIARNRNVNPSFRKWLIHLENGIHSVNIDIIQKQIIAEIGDSISNFSIKMEDNILSEASVGATVSFTWSEPGIKRESKGVFKVLKPGIKDHIGEELELLDRLALFFDKNREQYTLKNFRFIETFKDIKEALQEEINLCGEQANLKKAFIFYADDSSTRIPRTLPFSTKNITAMQFMEGCKITDISIESPIRKIFAETLFKTIFWSPLFSNEEKTIFHGDPHAGNIFAVDGSEIKEKQVVLIDWSLTGNLSKQQRHDIFRLIIGAIAQDQELICTTIQKLSKDKPDVFIAKKVKNIIREIAQRFEFINSSFVKKAFMLIDQTAISGIRFPKDLLLFRKAIFTVEGVLHTLDPFFDMDLYAIKLLEHLFIEELPKRWAYMAFPHADRAEHYKSLISNRELYAFFSNFYLKRFRNTTDIFSDFFKKYEEILKRYFPFWFNMVLVH